MADEESEIQQPAVDMSGVEAKLDALDQTIRQLLSEVTQLRSAVDNALD
tara:strand:+ start:9801 stop:9947 length:147 start_codon:yes stop_codon:yes gene_type:complete